MTLHVLETMICYVRGKQHNFTIDTVLIQMIDKSNVRYYRYVDIGLFCTYIISISVITLVYVVSGYSQSAPSVGHVCQDGCHVCFKNDYDELIKLPVKKTGVCDGTS